MRDVSYLTVWSGTYDVSVLVRVCGDEEGQQVSICNDTVFEDLSLAFEVCSHNKLKENLRTFWGTK